MIDFDDILRLLRGWWVSALFAAAVLSGRAAWLHIDEAEGAGYLVLSFGFALWGYTSARKLLAETRP